LAAKALDRQGLIGEWEGVDTSRPYAVYKMVISAEGEADLILLYSGSKNESMSIFFGHAKSIECDDGEVKIRFEMAPKHIKYFDWVEIRATAVGGDGYGFIKGQIINYRAIPSERQWSEQIALTKGKWFRDLENLSEKAGRILRGAKIESGRAVPK
jgi:hypothetical protein